MPYGTELILGFAGTEIAPAAEALSFEIDWTGEKYEGNFLGPDNVREKLDKKLEAAYLKCLGHFDFFENVRLEDPDAQRHYYLVDTPMGQRTMVPWELELAFDPDECGDEPDDAVFGVSLISRYFPTFLDWKDAHGGSGCTISLDAPTTAMIEQARAWIVTVLPNFTEARICIKTKFY